MALNDCEGYGRLFGGSLRVISRVSLAIFRGPGGVGAGGVGAGFGYAVGVSRAICISISQSFGVAWFRPARSVL